MSRPRGLKGHRTVVMAVRLTPEEAKVLVDDRRGYLDRSNFIRWTLQKAAKRTEEDPDGA